MTQIKSWLTILSIFLMFLTSIVFSQEGFNVIINPMATPQFPLLANPDTFITSINGIASTTGSWIATGSMANARRDHTATILDNGKVLIVGWFTNSAELYDPVSGIFSTTGSTIENHGQGSTATVLTDGRVLIVGGNGAQQTAEIYDPITGRFSLTNSLNTVHSYHTATRLLDGKVLIAAGQDNVGPQTHSVAELYDLVTGTFSFADSLIEDRSGHTATLLSNGQVLITGGTQTTTPGFGVSLSSAELYDPTIDSFNLTGSMRRDRSSHTATLLNNDLVLIIGNLFTDNSAELYDVITDAFTPAGNITVPQRGGHTATLLPNGQVLVAGGFVATGPVTTKSAELYDTITNTFSMTDNMITARQQHTATLLPDGRVLVAGGFDGSQNTDLTELFEITNSISNIQLSPPSPTSLVFDERVNITFDYVTNEAGGVRIFIRPFSNGLLTTNYAAHPSPIYPVGSGSGTGFFTIMSGDATVDQLRIQMLNADQGVLLLEFFIPVDYGFSSGADQNPPQISPTPITTGTSGQSLTVQVTLTDESGVQSATVFYRRGGASSYSSSSLSNPSGDTWESTISSGFISERGVEYYLSAQDAAGNSATFPAADPQNNPLVIRVTSSNLLFSSPNTAYRMISVPIDLDNSSPTNVLEDDLGSYDDTQWRLLRYINGNNVEFPNTGNFLSGTGFWLITRAARTLGTGSGTSISTGENYVITLSPGWNQIGNPFAFTVNWNDVVKNANIEDKLVGYSGSANDATGYDFNRTQLLPFEGYFVNNIGTSTTTIEIPPKSATGSSGVAKQNSGLSGLFDLQNDEWTLQLTAQSDRFLDKDNYIGVLNEASDTWDRKDFSEAPFFDSFVSLYFPHEDWEVYPGLYTGDFRSINTEGHFWDFHVKSNIANSEVVLNLANIQNLPSEMDIVLIDKASRISINLLEQDSYTFASGEEGAERDFRIVVGESDFVDSNDLDFSGIPETFTLSQNYPNPFNPETNIDYELPLGSEVKIAVFNLLGQQIRNLFNGKQNAGRYTVSWDGKSGNGLSVATGVYLVRMQAGKFVSVRKVLLTK